MKYTAWLITIRSAKIAEFVLVLPTVWLWLFIYYSKSTCGLVLHCPVLNNKTHLTRTTKTSHRKMCQFIWGLYSFYSFSRYRCCSTKIHLSAFPLNLFFFLWEKMVEKNPNQITNYPGKTLWCRVGCPKNLVWTHIW